MPKKWWPTEAYFYLQYEVFNKDWQMARFKGQRTADFAKA